MYGTTTPSSTQTVTLSGGSVPNSSTTAALTAGSYSFIGVYSGDSNYTGYTGAVEPLTINQGSSSVSTAIKDSGGGAVTDALGEKVYDTATVSGTPFTPTGTVTYYFYTTSNPVYGTTTPISTQTVSLSGGSVPNSATTAALTAGGYAYIGVYSGDSNYTSFVGAVEPLTVNQGSSSVSTTILDSGGGAVTDVLGEQVYDTATVSGTPFTPTGTVTYYFYTTASPVYGTTTPSSTQTVTLSGGSVPNSSTTAMLTAGSYAFIGVYSGDSNYAGFTGAVEPLTINKASSSVSTAIFDSGGGAVTGALGEKVYDTATVSGTPFTPTGTVTYYFYNTASPVYGTTTPVSTQSETLSGGLVPNSPVTSALTAGSYAYIGVYSGDINYEPIHRRGRAVDGEPGFIEREHGDQGFEWRRRYRRGAGEMVYDTATVTGRPFTPAGTVTYNFYNTSSPVYGTTTPVSTQPETLSGGTRAQLAGDVGVDGRQLCVHRRLQRRHQLHRIHRRAVEPLTINHGSSSVSTTIDNATTNQPISGNQPVGTSVYDTATVSGTGSITPTGTVTYYFYTTSTPVYGTTTPSTTQTVTLSGGVVPNSSATAALTAGGYAYIGVYSGDSNYTGYVGAVEPLTVVGTPNITVTKTADQATVTAGQTAGFVVTDHQQRHSHGHRRHAKRSPAARRRQRRELED